MVKYSFCIRKKKVQFFHTPYLSTYFKYLSTNFKYLLKKYTKSLAYS